LPISTPPNAIVYDKSDMKQKEMAVPGFFVTVVTNAILFGCAHTYNELVYGFRKYETKGQRYCSPR
jgi:di/tricarboxylate transporter